MPFSWRAEHRCVLAKFGRRGRFDRRGALHEDRPTLLPKGRRGVRPVLLQPRRFSRHTGTRSDEIRISADRRKRDGARASVHDETRLGCFGRRGCVRKEYSVGERLRHHRKGELREPLLDAQYGYNQHERTGGEGRSGMCSGYFRRGTREDPERIPGTEGRDSSRYSHCSDAQPDRRARYQQTQHARPGIHRGRGVREFDHCDRPRERVAPQRAVRHSPGSGSAHCPKRHVPGVVQHARRDLAQGGHIAIQ